MKKNFLDAIDVKTPCSESWEEMLGNETVRFCSHCAKNVHDISAMTRAKAEKLIESSNGKLCVRYVKNPNGKIVFAPPKFTQIKRRAGIAAGVLATSLTLSTLAYSQGEPILKKEETQQARNNNSKKSSQNLPTILGEIYDEHGALIPNAKVILRDIKTQSIRVTQSNDAGVFEFKDVEAEFFDIEIERSGFKTFFLKNLETSKSTNIFQKITLNSDAYEVVGELIVIGTEVECADVKPTETIEQQKTLELPTNDRRIVTMGLIPAAQSETKPKEKDVKSKNKKKKN